MVDQISTTNANIEIKDTQLTNNNATNGGANANYGYTKIEYSQLNNNIATRGGVNYNFGNITIFNSTFNSNYAKTNAAVNYNDKGTITIKESKLNENEAEENGGCNYNNQGNIKITSSYLNDNRATRGGVNYNDGELTIQDSSLNSNVAKNGGVNYNNNKGKLTILESWSKSNSAQRAADTYNNNGKLTITDTEFNDNSGIYDASIIINYGNNTKLEDNLFFQQDYYNEVLLYTNQKINANNNIFKLTEAKSVNQSQKFSIKSPIKDISLKSSISAYDNTNFEEYLGTLTKTKDKTYQLIHTYTTSGEKEIEFMYPNNSYYIYIYLDVDMLPTPPTYIEPTTPTIPETPSYPVVDDNEKEYNVYSYSELKNALSDIKSLSTYKDCTINICSDMKITGMLLWADANKIRRLTINGNGHTLNGQNKYKFMSVKPGYTLILKTMSIINCNSKDYSNYEDDGGAIRNDGTLNVDNVYFTNNKAYRGGAICNYGKTFISDSSFRNNNATIAGAIFNYGDGLNVTSSSFKNNDGYHAGTICNYDKFYIANSDFINNNPKGVDGTICNVGNTFGYVISCKFNGPNEYVKDQDNSYTTIKE